jgi:hypothetical protein
MLQMRFGWHLGLGVIFGTPGAFRGFGANVDAIITLMATFAVLAC